MTILPRNRSGDKENRRARPKPRRPRGEARRPVRARKGDLGIIPGSMGTGSFIVRGLGNADSFCSCSHGAGRAMSRNEARRRITLEDHQKAVAGVECRTDAEVIDESPAAYKDISAVIAAQSDLIEIVHRLRQVVNVTG